VTHTRPHRPTRGVPGPHRPVRPGVSRYQRCASGATACGTETLSCLRRGPHRLPVGVRRTAAPWSTCALVQQRSVRCLLCTGRPSTTPPRTTPMGLTRLDGQPGEDHLSSGTRAIWEGCPSSWRPWAGSRLGGRGGRSRRSSRPPRSSSCASAAAARSARSPGLDQLGRGLLHICVKFQTAGPSRARSA
jgi:hypothetical protein